MAKILKPMQGIRLWRNEVNGFVVFECHYSADSEKCTAEWKKMASAGISKRQWDQEYEIKFSSYEGLPVYGDFSEEHKLLIQPKSWVGLPMLIGFDFGLTPAAVIAQLQEERLVVMKEYVAINMGAERFMNILGPKLRQDFPKHPSFRNDWLCFIDPAGTFRKDNDEGTCAQVLSKAGFITRPGPVAWETRRQSVEHFLVRRNRQGPLFGIYEKDCPTLVKGFEGGYRYPKGADVVEKATLAPVKDKHSHPHDGLQYICAGILGWAKKSSSVTPKRPSYRS